MMRAFLFLCSSLLLACALSVDTLHEERLLAKQQLSERPADQLQGPFGPEYAGDPVPENGGV